MSLSESDLERLADLVAARLRAAPAPPAPLVTKDQLAAAWRVSTTTINRLVKAGMPIERVTGDVCRFDVAACDAWRRARPVDTPAPAVEERVSMEGVRLVHPGVRK